MGRRPRRGNIGNRQPGKWLREAERLYADFKELTPYPYRPFVRTFSSFAEYERWKRAQSNPWYR